MNRQYYRATFVVPFEFEVEILEEDLMINRAEEKLMEKTHEYMERYEGQVAFKFNDLKMKPWSLHGVSIDHLPPEETAKYNRMILAGRFK